MKLRCVIPMKIAKYGYIAISVIFCVAGILIIWLSAISAKAVSISFGIMCLILGVIKLIGYFSKDLFRLAFQYDLQFGVLLNIIGIITLVKSEKAMEFICIAFGISLIAEALFKGKISFEAKSFGIHWWWITLVCAFVNVAVGLLLALCPVATIRGVNILLGFSMIAVGILNLCVAISMVKIVDHQQPDAIDIENYEEWEGK